MIKVFTLGGKILALAFLINILAHSSKVREWEHSCPIPCQFILFGLPTIDKKPSCIYCNIRHVVSYFIVARAISILIMIQTSSFFFSRSPTVNLGLSLPTLPRIFTTVGTQSIVPLVEWILSVHLQKWSCAAPLSWLAFHHLFPLIFPGVLSPFYFSSLGDYRLYHYIQLIRPLKTPISL